MLATIRDMPTSAWLVIGLLVSMATAVLGMVTNAVLQDRGFGAVPNGLLMLIGFGAGAWVRFSIWPA